MNDDFDLKALVSAYRDVLATDIEAWPEKLFGVAGLLQDGLEEDAILCLLKVRMEEQKKALASSLSWESEAKEYIEKYPSLGDKLRITFKKIKENVKNPEEKSKESWKEQLRVRKYEFMEEIYAPQNATSKVWKAKHQISGVFVAIKLLDSRDAKDLERFNQEQFLTEQIRHPNIIQVRDVGKLDDGTPYIVMDFANGGSLVAYCCDEHLALENRLELFMQLCSAVEALHGNSVCHRDLKSPNVLINEELSTSDSTIQPGQRKVPRVRLIDLGLAKAGLAHVPGYNTDQTIRGVFVGTLPYASLEQLKDSSRMDMSNDIYSLGVILYELLTGESPIPRSFFESGSFEHVRNQLLEELNGTAKSDLAPMRPSKLLNVALHAAVKNKGENSSATRQIASPQRKGMSQDQTPKELENAKFFHDYKKVMKHVASYRREPEELIRGVQGDLDCIVMAAIHVDKIQREKIYPDVESLRLDIRRFLEGDAIKAHASSLFYDLRKTARRHRSKAWMGLFALVACVSLLGLYFSYLESHTIRAENVQKTQRLKLAITEGLLYSASKSVQEQDFASANIQISEALAKGILTGDEYAARQIKCQLGRSRNGTVKLEVEGKTLSLAFDNQAELLVCSLLTDDATNVAELMVRRINPTDPRFAETWSTGQKYDLEELKKVNGRFHAFKLSWDGRWFAILESKSGKLTLHLGSTETKKIASHLLKFDHQSIIDAGLRFDLSSRFIGVYAETGNLPTGEPSGPVHIYQWSPDELKLVESSTVRFPAEFAICPDGTIYAAGLELLDTGYLSRIGRKQIGTSRRVPRIASVIQPFFLPNRQVHLSIDRHGAGNAQLIDVLNERSGVRFDVPASMLMTSAVSISEAMLATANQKGELCIQNISDEYLKVGRRIATVPFPELIRHIAISHDDSLLAVCTDSGSVEVIKLQEMTAKSDIVNFELGPSSGVSSLGLDSQGQRLWSGYYTNSGMRSGIASYDLATEEFGRHDIFRPTYHARLPHDQLITVSDISNSANATYLKKVKVAGDRHATIWETALPHASIADVSVDRRALLLYPSPIEQAASPGAAALQNPFPTGRSLTCISAENGQVIWNQKAQLGQIKTATMRKKTGAAFVSQGLSEIVLIDDNGDRETTIPIPNITIQSIACSQNDKRCGIVFSGGPSCTPAEQDSRYVKLTNLVTDSAVGIAVIDRETGSVQYAQKWAGGASKLGLFVAEFSNDGRFFAVGDALGTTVQVIDCDDQTDWRIRTNALMGLAFEDEKSLLLHTDASSMLSAIFSGGALQHEIHRIEMAKAARPKRLCSVDFPIAGFEMLSGELTIGNSWDGKVYRVDEGRTSLIYAPDDNSFESVGELGARQPNDAGGPTPIAMAVSPDDRWVAGIGADGTVSFRSTQTGSKPQLNREMVKDINSSGTTRAKTKIGLDVEWVDETTFFTVDVVELKPSANRLCKLDLRFQIWRAAAGKIQPITEWQIAEVGGGLEGYYLETSSKRRVFSWDRRKREVWLMKCPNNDDCRIEILDVMNGKTIKYMKGWREKSNEWHPMQENAFAIWAPFVENGRVAANVVEPGKSVQVEVWDGMRSGLHSLYTTEATALSKTSNPVIQQLVANALALTPDGSELAVAKMSDVIELHSITLECKLNTMKNPSPKQVSALRFSPTGDDLVIHHPPGFTLLKATPKSAQPKSSQ